MTTCSKLTSGEVVVVAGYAIAQKPVRKVDTIPAIIRKVFRNEAFKAYPNPAPKGTILHIAIKKAGEYSIQVLDNSSKLLLAEAFITESNNAVAPINIPSSFAAGIYYIRIIDERKKKSYVDKVIVQ